MNIWKSLAINIYVSCRLVQQRFAIRETGGSRSSLGTSRTGLSAMKRVYQIPDSAPCKCIFQTQQDSRTFLQTTTRIPTDLNSVIPIRHPIPIHHVHVSRARDVLGRQDDIVLEIKRGFVVALARLEVDDQVVLDGEDGVGGEVGVVRGEDLGGDGFEAGVGDL